MIVHIPSPLLAYTNMQKKVEASRNTIHSILDDLNNQFSGIVLESLMNKKILDPILKFLSIQNKYLLSITPLKIGMKSTLSLR
jgi:hypothetical protein